MFWGNKFHEIGFAAWSSPKPFEIVERGFWSGFEDGYRSTLTRERARRCWHGRKDHLRLYRWIWWWDICWRFQFSEPIKLVPKKKRYPNTAERQTSRYVQHSLQAVQLSIWKARKSCDVAVVNLRLYKYKCKFYYSAWNVAGMALMLQSLSIIEYNWCNMYTERPIKYVMPLRPVVSFLVTNCHKFRTS